MKRNAQTATSCSRHEAEKAIYEQLHTEWPPIMAINEIGKYTGGLLAPKTLFNILSDCNQESPPTIKIGRRRGITKQALLNWLKSTGRLNVINQ